MKKQTVIAVVWVTIVLTIVLLGLWLSAHKIAAAIVVTAIAALFILLTHVGAFAAGIWWGRESVRMGADIAIRAQNFNDQWDTRKTTALANMATAMIKLGHSTAKEASPLPPLLEIGEHFPPLEECVEGELVSESRRST